MSAVQVISFYCILRVLDRVPGCANVILFDILIYFDIGFLYAWLFLDINNPSGRLARLLLNRHPHSINVWVTLGSFSYFYGILMKKICHLSLLTFFYILNIYILIVLHLQYGLIKCHDGSCIVRET